MNFINSFIFFLFSFNFLFATDLTESNNTVVKPNCLLYGNCQSGTLYKYLKTNYPDMYNYNYIINWKKLKDKDYVFPAEIAKNADIFIYQPLKNHGNLDTDFIKNNLLKKSCVCISMPYILFLGYFPDYVHPDERNDKTKSKKYTFGAFPYGHGQLNKLILKNCYTINEIIELSRKDDFLSEDFIWNKLETSLQVLREREKSTDIKIADFIEQNYDKFKLFHSVNHPTNYLYKELIKQVLLVLHLDTNGVDKNQFFKREVGSVCSNPIIYPCVVKALNLPFNTENTNCLKKSVTYNQFIEKYFQLLYPEYCKQGVPKIDPPKKLNLDINDHYRHE